jgi:hypothetical protein
MDIYFPNPTSEFVRNMLYRKNSKNRKPLTLFANPKELENVRKSASPRRDDINPTEESQEGKEHNHLQQTYQVKMFQVFRSKFT